MKPMLPLVTAIAAATVLWLVPVRADEAARRVPPPAVDVPLAKAPGTATAVFAGGCFWGLEGMFEHVAGVRAVRSGYAGGGRTTAHYEIVGSGLTGHAEAVEVHYDPAKISYGALLQLYFSVAHDPTQLNRQTPDSGTQYRSTVFARDSEQARLATAYIAQLNRAHVFAKPVVTTVETGKPFFAAEGYHQDFLKRNPDYPYIVANDLPKIDALKRLFPERYVATPVG